MNGGKTCCFTGHHDPPDWVKAALAESVEYHINKFGVKAFLVGDYGGFDRLALSTVTASKRKHPDVKLYHMLAYFPTPGEDRDLNGCDGIVLPEGQETIPAKIAIPCLNQRMVNDSDYLIAFVSHISGGAYRTLEYARRRQRRGKIAITNLWDPFQKHKIQY